MKIKNISISGLHGSKNICIPITDNKIVLVGENGSGKTTIVTLIHYCLTSQWSAAEKINFDSIKFTFDSGEISIAKNEIKSYLRLSETGKESDSIDSYIIQRLKKIDANRYKTTEEAIKKICDDMRMPENIRTEITNRMKIFDFTALKQLTEKSSKIESMCPFIIFMPTYRRIEKELDTIFPEFTKDFAKFEHRFNKVNSNLRYFELVKFGMKDVRQLIDDSLTELKASIRDKLNSLTAGYLKFVIENKGRASQKDQISQFTDDVLKRIFDRIQFSDQHLIDPSAVINNMHEINQKHRIDPIDNVVIKYITLLKGVDIEQSQNESQIRMFVSICNKYLGDKQMILNQAKYELRITQNESGEEIDFDDLSSGEKQIASIFAHLLLGKMNSYFLIFDEPELSLSVDWQRKFLEDIAKLPSCSGLIAVTHSPFIFENSLDKFAISIEECQSFARVETSHEGLVRN